MAQPETASSAPMWMGKSAECNRPSCQSTRTTAALATRAMTTVTGVRANATVQVGAATRSGER